VTRSLGERRILPDYYVDSLVAATGEAYLHCEPGDLLVICSDGLWEPVDEAVMENVLKEHRQLNRAASELIHHALRQGGPDNATVVLLRLNSLPQ
jgi:serine/threonine protein phosphatase PrpC